MNESPYILWSSNDDLSAEIVHMEQAGMRPASDSFSRPKEPPMGRSNSVKQSIEYLLSSANRPSACSSTRLLSLDTPRIDKSQLSTLCVAVPESGCTPGGVVLSPC
jgi:hypothetical protein